MTPLELKNRIRTHDWKADYTAALIERLELLKVLAPMKFADLFPLLEELPASQRVEVIRAIDTFVQNKKRGL